jgi:hypothetical protein
MERSYNYEHDNKKILHPNKTFNQSVEAEIEREGSLNWVERVLTEQLVDWLVQKEWYPEAAYGLDSSEYWKPYGRVRHCGITKKPSRA